MFTRSFLIPRHLLLFVPIVAVLVLISLRFLQVIRNANSTSQNVSVSSANPILEPAAIKGVSDAGMAARLNSTYGKLPISFEANSGQFDEQVNFTAQGKGYKVFLTGDGAVISLRAVPFDPKMNAHISLAPGVAHALAMTTRKTASVRLKLLGTNPETEVAGAGKLQGVSNYYIGKDPTKWRTNVPTYAQVRYRGIYPGVDLLYYGNEGRLEHDFVVAPGADPQAIAMEIQGGEGVEETSAGDLRLKTDSGDLSLLKPTVYQLVNHDRRKIPAKYVVAGKQVRFQVGEFDHALPLIIDPVLMYSTLLGGSNFDSGFAIALDNSRNAYVAGQTTSSDFPLKNAIDSVHGAINVDRYVAFVSKFNSDGSAMIYSTFLGGDISVDARPAYTGAAGIAVDSTGAAYVTGTTAVADFPIKNAYQPESGGADDAYVTKLSSSGSLIFSTYVGGAGDDQGHAIAIDKSGNSYITGRATGNFPATNHFPSNAITYPETFVTKLNANGNGLIYSDILGSSYGSGIAVDLSGNAYITGSASAAFPVFSAFQPKFGGGAADAFVTKISPSGDYLLYSTFLGGNANEGGSSIAVDSSGDAYIAGTIYRGDVTECTFPITWNAFQRRCLGYNGGFITKLRPSGGLLYSTYFGGGYEDWIYAIAVDQYRTAYIAGTTRSSGFPLFASLRPALDQDQGFVATLVPSGELGKSIHYYSTTIGAQLPGEPWSGGTNLLGIAIDSALNAYVTGSTTYVNYPTTRGAFQTSLKGGGNAFVSKLTIAADLGLANIASPITAVQGNNLTYTLSTRNNGPDWAVNLRLNDPIPAGTTFVSYNAGGGTCAAPAVGSTGTLSCTLPRLDKGATWNVQLVVRVNAAKGSTIVNPAHVVSNMQDLLSQNNYATSTMPIN